MTTGGPRAPRAADRDAVDAWHAVEIDVALARLDVDPSVGLTSGEVVRRLATYGRNRLRDRPPRPAWLQFADQFRSLLAAILAAAAVLSLAVGDVKDAVAILAVLLLNASFGFYQEYAAGRSIASLARMLPSRARVRRGGIVVEVDAQEVVPGDLVHLEAGAKVPADGRLVSAYGLAIDEAALTGESHASEKSAGRPVAAAAPIAERPNVAFMNTVVTRGRGEMVVTATGMATEIGRIADLIQTLPEPATPLQRQLDRLGKRLAAIACALVAVVFCLAIFRGDALSSAALSAITLAVAAIPEGLPAVVTVTLALGMRRMARNRAIVKRLAAVETLGCTTVICTDKTGTLTVNQMTARRLLHAGRRYTVTGEGYAAQGAILAPDGAAARSLGEFLLPAVLCNDSRVRAGNLVGDPTEGALVVLGQKAGLDAEGAAAERPRIAEVPFDSGLQYMATFHRDGEGVLVCVKGSPNAVLARATRVASERGDRELDDADRASVACENDAMGRDGLRVLAVATRRLDGRDFSADADLSTYARDLTFQGLVGIVDPPRPVAREAVLVCKQAGIRVKMITGDQATTAAAIAGEVGLDPRVVEGASLDGMTAAEFDRIAADAGAFARVSPEHKLRLVSALQRAGHVVAMTGDGVNDAPALRGADIGVAMGVTGTEVSKEAAAMVLTDDNFATIVRAVREGRAIYDNILKFVRFQLATNIGALGTMLGASLLAWPVPFTPLQILWVNLIMDGPPAMALGVDPARPGIMHEPPRRSDSEILTWTRVAKLSLGGATMAIGTLLVFRMGLLQDDPGKAGTLAFTTFVLFQLFNLLNARSETASVLGRQLFRNPALWIAMGAMIVLQAIVVYVEPVRTLFHTVALDAGDWALALAAASSLLFVEEMRKLVERLLDRRERSTAVRNG